MPNKILSDHLEWNKACYFTETALLNWVICVVYSRISSDVKFAFSLQHRTGFNNIILFRHRPVLICFKLISKVSQSRIVTEYFQARSQNCEKWLLASSHLSSSWPSVCPSAWNNSAPTVWIFMKSDIWVLLENAEKMQISLKSYKNNGYFTWRPVCFCNNISLSSC